MKVIKSTSINPDFEVSEPVHRTHIKYVSAYSGCKRWGVQGIYTFLAGTGLWGVVKEVAQGTVVQYGKRRLATIVIGGVTYVCAPAVMVITNAIRVLKSCKLIYT